MTTTVPKPTHQVIKWNGNTGHVSKVGKVAHFCQQDAQDEADRRNAAEGREFRNVKWGVRSI